MENSCLDYRNDCYFSNENDIVKFCEEVCKEHVNTVSVLPFYVSKVRELIGNSCIQVAALIDYPCGGNNVAVKEYASIVALEETCDEIIFVLNHGAIRDKNYGYIQKEIETIRDAADGKDVRALLYTDCLSDDEILKTVEICNKTFIHSLEISGCDYDCIQSTLSLISNVKGEVLELVVSGEFNKEEMVSLLEQGVSKIVVCKEEI